MNNILEILENMTDWELVGLWNEYQDNNHYEEQLFEMSDFPYIVDTGDFFETYGKIDHNHFDPCDDYFYFDIYGDICSTSDPRDVIDLDDLACYIEDNIEEYDYLLKNV